MICGRVSPALHITAQLGREGLWRVLAVEPHVDSLPASLKETDVRLCGLDEALAEADIVLGLVAHRGFRKVSRQRRQAKIVIDICGIWR